MTIVIFLPFSYIAVVSFFYFLCYTIYQDFINTVKSCTEFERKDEKNTIFSLGFMNLYGDS